VIVNNDYSSSPRETVFITSPTLFKIEVSKTILNSKKLVSLFLIIYLLIFLLSEMSSDTVAEFKKAKETENQSFDNRSF